MNHFFKKYKISKKIKNVKCKKIKLNGLKNSENKKVSKKIKTKCKKILTV